MREQLQWTVNEIKARSEELADRALEIWLGLDVDKALIKEADLREMRELASRRNVAQIQMSPKARELFDALSEEVKNLGDVIEIAERKSISYHAPYFLLEVLPRKYELVLLLPIDFSEIDDPNEIAEDANEWKFIPNAKHDGGVIVHVWKHEHISTAITMVRQAFNIPVA